MKTGFFLIAMILCFLNSSAQVEFGEYTDQRDSRVYKTVKIGSQTWMAENLAFKTDSGSWLYDNPEDSTQSYGRLYDWNAAKHACPSGWHLPDKDEWMVLANFCGGEEVAADKLKSVGEWHTMEGISYGENTSGFSALPAGARTEDGDFVSLGKYAFFWTSTPYGNVYNNSYYVSLSYSGSWVGLHNNSPVYGYSVRCVKD